MKTSPKKQKNERGSVLIMSIILLSGFMIVATEFAILIVSGIRQARSIDNATRAYYAAEGGAESALYQVRKENPGASTILRNAYTNPSPTGASWYMNNAVTSPGTFSDSVDYIDRAVLVKNDSIELGLYSGTGGAVVGTPGAQSIMVEWTKAICPTGHPDPWVEVGVINWTPDSSQNIDWDTASVPAKTAVKKFFKTSTTNSIVVNAFDPSKPSSVRVKAYYCDLRGLKISVYNGANAGGSRLRIPNYYFINPLGKAGDTQAQLQVIMPKKAPTSSLYDYVLFSEDAVGK